MINVAELITDPDFATTFTRERVDGGFVNGRWVNNAPVQLSVVGIIQPATSPDDLEPLPEGERANEAIRIWSLIEIRKGDGESVLSDYVIFGGNKYRVYAVKPWALNGFYQSFAVSVGGA